MDNQNNNPEVPQDDSWLDEVLGEQEQPQEIGADEFAVAGAGLRRPGEAELDENPRARSAKLRVAEQCGQD